MRASAARLAAFYDDLTGQGHPYGVPYEDEHTGLLLVRCYPNRVRAATWTEVEHFRRIEGPKSGTLSASFKADRGL